MYLTISELEKLYKDIEKVLDFYRNMSDEGKATHLRCSHKFDDRLEDIENDEW